MLQAKDLLDHATRLLANSACTDADCRRAVSASYYAAFHLISAAVADQACPANPQGLRGRFQRGLDHNVMKNAMAAFITPKSLRDLSAKIRIPCIHNLDLADLAKAFGELQDARYLADYDVEDSEGTVGFSWAKDWVDKAILVFDAWNRAKSTDEAKLLLAYLIFGNKWAK